MNNLIAFGLGLAVTLLPGSFLYQNLQGELELTQINLEEVESKNDDLLRTVDAKKLEIEQLSNNLTETQKELNNSQANLKNKQAEINSQLQIAKQLKTETRTVSRCLQGFATGFVAFQAGYYEDALFNFASVSESCEKAGTIIDNLDNSGINISSNSTRTITY